MADFLDDLIAMSKDLNAIKDEVSSVGNSLVGGESGPAVPPWSPSDYKEVPRVDASYCVRCRDEESVCTLCEDICPVDCIVIEDGGIEINSDCRKCGLCVSTCPTGVYLSTKVDSRKVYDKICATAVSGEMCYVTCTRALGHYPEPSTVVLPCIGDVNAETWFGVLNEFDNVAVYLPVGKCDKCKTTTGEQAMVDAITKAEQWSDRAMDLKVSESELVHGRDHDVERRAFVSNTAKSMGVTASKINPITRKLTSAAKRLSENKERIERLTKTISKTGGTSTTKKRRALTSGRQILLATLSDFPFLADRVNIQIPVANADCTACGDCAEFCPINAMDIVGDHAEVQAMYCTGCGLCIQSCTVGALSMEERTGELIYVEDPDAKEKAAIEAAKKKNIEQVKQGLNKAGKAMEHLDE